MRQYRFTVIFHLLVKKEPVKFCGKVPRNEQVLKQIPTYTRPMVIFDESRVLFYFLSKKDSADSFVMNGRLLEWI